MVAGATLTQLGEALRGAEAAGCGLTEFAELRSLGGGKVSQDTRDSFPPPKVTEMLKRCEKAVQTAVEGEAAAQQSDDDRTNGVLAAAMKSKSAFPPHMISRASLRGCMWGFRL